LHFKFQRILSPFLAGKGLQKIKIDKASTIKIWLSAAVVRLFELLQCDNLVHYFDSLHQIGYFDVWRDILRRLSPIKALPAVWRETC
jgi:hypothetical protein